MQRLILAVILTVFSALPAAWAEKMYVTDTMEITLRTGPGLDHKIISMLPSGRPVERVDKGENWSQVQLEDGRTGWVLNRFISKNRPSSILLEELRVDHQKVAQQAAELLEENTRLKSENETLSAELDVCRKKASQLAASLENLQNDCSEYFTLKEQHQNCTARLQSQTRSAKELAEALKKANEKRIYYWFLCGAGVLVLGFLIGLSVRRERRRSSLL